MVMSLPLAGKSGGQLNAQHEIPSHTFPLAMEMMASISFSGKERETALLANPRHSETDGETYTKREDDKGEGTGKQRRIFPEPCHMDDASERNPA